MSDLRSTDIIETLQSEAIDSGAAGGRSVVVHTRLVRAGRQFISDAAHSRSEKTRNEYARHWQRFIAWCDEHDLIALPTEPQTVALYFGYLAGPHETTDSRGRVRRHPGCGKSTFAVVRAAIRSAHENLPTNTVGRDVDLATPEIKRFLKGNPRRTKIEGRSVNKAAPFTVDDWLLLREHIGSDLHDIRDLALLGIGIVRALRGPSELVALDLAPRLVGSDARGEIHVRRSGAVVRMFVTKSDQLGDGHDREIENGPALNALQHWIQVAKIMPSAPLFRPIRWNPLLGRHVIGKTRLSGRTLQQIVQKRAGEVLAIKHPGWTTAEIRAKAAAYSTHSLRHGALTSLAAAGAQLSELQELSRHSRNSANILLGYIKSEQQGAKAMKRQGM